MHRKPIRRQLSTDQDKALSILLTGSDEDGNIITYSVVGNPQHGQLSGTAPNLTYTPTSGYFGADSFTFRTYDGKLYSDAATVAITVKQIAAPVRPTVQYVNYPPTADEQTLITEQDKNLKITLTGKDQNGDALSFAVVKQTANGKLTGTAPDMTYTPNPGFYGQDNFTFKANDGQADSEAAIVRITVKRLNRAPIADEQTLITDRDKALKITLTGSDPEGSMLSFAIVNQPANGQLTGTAPDMVYTPNPGFYGQDNFTFKVNDGLWTSDTATVQITVNWLNGPPKADDQTVITEHNKNLKITLTGSDPDGDPITYLMVNPPVNGQLTGTAPNLTYTPTSGYSGTDSFTFKVNDGKADSVVATVNMTVKPNQPPKADGQTLTAKNDRDLKITLTGSDPDGEPLTYLIVMPPVLGQLTGTAPNLTYTPNKEFIGADRFTFKVNDGKADSVVATVKITVKPNSPPQAQHQSLTVEKDKDLKITLTGSDPDDDTITYYVISNPGYGQLTGTAPNLIYTPKEGFSGEDRFMFIVNDGKAHSAVATVNMIIKVEEGDCALFIAASADAGNSLPSAGILFVLIGLGLAGLLYDEKRVK